MSLPIYRSSFINGLSQGFLLTFAGGVVASFLSVSISVIIAVVLLLAFVGGIVLGLSRLLTEKEEWSEMDRQAVQKEFTKEQQILSNIGISQETLEIMQKEMKEEQEFRINDLPELLPERKIYKTGLFLFAGYSIAGITTSFFLYISDMHIVISAVMILGVKFAAELYKNTKLLMTPYPLTRTLLNIVATAVIFTGIYWLPKIIVF